jgi:hypothetical protein
MLKRELVAGSIACTVVKLENLLPSIESNEDE